MMVTSIAIAECRYCLNSGVITAGPDAEPVWCVCEWGRRAHLLHTEAWRYLDEHGFAPTVRDLMRSTGLTMHRTLSGIDRLERAGLVERRRRNARSLRVIRGGRA